MKICKSELATRPILYTDSVGGEQTLRDDLWAVTTDELNSVIPITRTNPIICSMCAGVGMVGGYSGNPPEPDGMACPDCGGWGVRIPQPMLDDAAHKFYGRYTELPPRLKQKLSIDDLVTMWRKMVEITALELVAQSLLTPTGPEGG